MATYNTNAYALEPPQEGTRSRGNSNADRYRPRAYSDAPPTQPNPELLGPYQQPQYPPVAPPPQMPPYTQPNTYASQNHLSGQAALPEHMQPTHAQNDGYGSSRPRDDYERRHSHSSQRSHRSHHSHDSRRSHASHKSHDSKRSHHSKHFEDDSENRKYRKQSKSTKEEPRSLGGSLFAVFDLVKSALGPRDKY